MLGQRRRQWANIKRTLVQRLVFAEDDNVLLDEHTIIKIWTVWMNILPLFTINASIIINKLGNLSVVVVIFCFFTQA